MTLPLDVFWSFRSPYSYLAAGRLSEIAQHYDVDMRFRPVLPIAVRDPGFFKQVNPAWVPYLLKDVARLAAFYGLPYRWPRPDPVATDPETRAIAADQPHIFRLTRLGAAAAEAGRGIEFMVEVSRVLFDGSTTGWHEGDHLEQAATRAGCNWSQLSATAETESARLDELIEVNRLDLEAAGHWGVPTVVFQGEPFFGQDRLDVLVWTMERAGVQPGAPA